MTQKRRSTTSDKEANAEREAIRKALTETEGPTRVEIGPRERRGASIELVREGKIVSSRRGSGR
jgi:hypothetical protein